MEHDDARLLELLERLALAGAYLEANSQRLGEVRDHLAAISDEIRNSRKQRDTRLDAPLAALTDLLDTQPVIEQAKGILIARTGCSAAEALDTLRSEARQRNVRIDELAAETVRQAARPRPSGVRPAPQPGPGARAAGHSKGVA